MIKESLKPINSCEVCYSLISFRYGCILFFRMEQFETDLKFEILNIEITSELKTQVFNTQLLKCKLFPFTSFCQFVHLTAELNQKKRTDFHPNLDGG